MIFSTLVSTPLLISSCKKNKPDTTTHLTLCDLQQIGGNGGVMDSTGIKFNLKDFSGNLEIDQTDITITSTVISGSGTLSFGTISYDDTEEHAYIVDISGDWENETEIKLNINKQGYTFDGTQNQKATLYKEAENHTTVSNFRCNGEYNKNNTTRISFNVSKAIEQPFSSDNLIFAGVDDLVLDGFVFDMDKKEYKLNILGTWSEGTQLSLTLNKNDHVFEYSDDWGPCVLHKDNTAHFRVSDLECDGEDGVATTKIYFKCNGVIEGGLNSSNITIRTEEKAEITIVDVRQGFGQFAISISGEWLVDTETTLELHKEGITFDISGNWTIYLKW